MLFWKKLKIIMERSLCSQQSSTPELTASAAAMPQAHFCPIPCPGTMQLHDSLPRGADPVENYLFLGQVNFPLDQLPEVACSATGAVPDQVEA